MVSLFNYLTNSAFPTIEAANLAWLFSKKKKDEEDEDDFGGYSWQLPKVDVNIPGQEGKEIKLDEELTPPDLNVTPPSGPPTGLGPIGYGPWSVGYHPIPAPYVPPVGPISGIPGAEIPGTPGVDLGKISNFPLGPISGIPGGEIPKIMPKLEDIPGFGGVDLKPIIDKIPGVPGAYIPGIPGGKLPGEIKLPEYDFSKINWGEYKLPDGSFDKLKLNLNFPGIKVPEIAGAELGDWSKVAEKATGGLQYSNGNVIFKPSNEQLVQIAQAVSDVFGRSPNEVLSYLGQSVGKVLGKVGEGLGIFNSLMGTIAPWVTLFEMSKAGGEIMGDVLYGVGSMMGSQINQWAKGAHDSFQKGFEDLGGMLDKNLQGIGQGVSKIADKYVSDVEKSFGGFMGEWQSLLDTDNRKIAVRNAIDKAYTDYYGDPKINKSALTINDSKNATWQDIDSVLNSTTSADKKYSLLKKATETINDPFKAGFDYDKVRNTQYRQYASNKNLVAKYGNEKLMQIATQYADERKNGFLAGKSQYDKAVNTAKDYVDSFSKYYKDTANQMWKSASEMGQLPDSKQLSEAAYEQAVKGFDKIYIKPEFNETGQNILKIPGLVKAF